MCIRDSDYGMIDGIINNGPKEPTVAQLEQQARSGQPISLKMCIRDRPFTTLS